ncbi:MAG: tetratricopeptide repeat protein [Calditrichaeota bacterium]|nr:MAG: tetratricopeptide repeat protein [Calditrichota bacterium]
MGVCNKNTSRIRIAVTGAIKAVVLLVTCLALAVMGTPAGGWAQQADGGYESIFSYGVGARALGLGGAYIAAPSDASAVYWNPGGLDYLTRKSVSLFYSTLPLDGQYNFVGYVHPTVSLGTFGVGVLRVGTDHVKVADIGGEITGSLAFAQTEFLIAYGRKLPYNVSLGASIKIEQQDFQFSGAPASGRGIGADIGLVYGPEWMPDFLQNLQFGVIVQNVIPPILKVAEAQQREPRNYKFGFAMPFRLSSRADALTFYADFEKGENKAMKMHFGAEYAYQGGAMLRIGYNENQVVFGAGIAFKTLQIDYSYGSYSFSPEFPQNHRVSITLAFGKTKKEIIELAKRRREEAIEAEVAQRAKFYRELEIKNNLEAGKSFYQRGDYWEAYIKFTAARDLDPNNPEANLWVKRADLKIKEEEKRREEESKKQFAENYAAQQRKAFIENQLRKGMAYFNAGQYNKALTEWKLGLERDPQNPKLKMWVEKTQNQIEKRIRDLRRQAEILANRGKYLEAIDKLSELKRLGAEDKNLQARVDAEMTRLQKRMNYEESYRRGVTEYFNKNYKAAMQFFQQALRLDPTNEKVRTYYQKAEARANAREEPFKTEEIQRSYKRAVLLYARRQYKAALEILQKIQKLQPYNKQILKLIDDTEDAMRNK